MVIGGNKVERGSGKPTLGVFQSNGPSVEK